jgi:ribosome-binding protein aMBF1 (putative translation factor)
MPPQKSTPPLDAIRLEQRKRQVARRLRRICPGIRDEELAEIIDRVARIELEHDRAQLGYSYKDLAAEMVRWEAREPATEA